MYLMKNTTLTIAFLFIFIGLRAEVPAFPGAEGFGRLATGGRGGLVYFVNTLEDNTIGNATTHEGSLRWCLSRSGVKTILFKVSGTIFLKTSLSITTPNITIAGQSAPGGGVTLGGSPVTISADNVVLRYLRFRMGDELSSNADGADALGARQHKNIIIDHCSMSWSTDECVSIYENENTTVQWCIISESLRLSGHSKGPHGYGGIWGGANASFHHNLMAHHDSRTPRFGPGSTTQLKELVDMRNCVIYNWSGNGCYGAEAMKINIVNNFYKPGPSTPTGSKRARIVAIDKKTGLSSSDGFYPINDVFGQFYIQGNVIDKSTSTSSSDINYCNIATADNWSYGVYNQISGTYGITAAQKTALKVDQPFDFGNVTTHSAALAYQKVMEYAGASLSRDSYDQRIVAETRAGTAAFRGLSPYNGLGSVTYPAGTVIGSTTLTVATTIDWKSTAYPKWGIIDSQKDLKPADAPADWSAWPTLETGTYPIDSNVDGIPDGWLEANYPGKSSNDLNEEGYTLLEVYLNILVSSITTLQNNNWPVAVSQNSEKKLKCFVSENQLNFSSPELISKIEIYNLQGFMLKNQLVNSDAGTLDISSLAKGLYLFKFNLSNYSQQIVQKYSIL